MTSETRNMSRSTLNLALAEMCLYQHNSGEFGFGKLDEKKTVEYPVILTPWCMPNGEYIVLHSDWNDIGQSPLVERILEELPRTEIVLRAGRQALKFHKGDEVFLRMLFSK